MKHKELKHLSRGELLELLLPLTEDKAVLDAGVMTWLEDSTLTYEYRKINEEDVLCQVLTGYKHVTSGEDGGKVVSGSFTETVTVLREYRSGRAGGGIRTDLPEDPADQRGKLPAGLGGNGSNARRRGSGSGDHRVYRLLGSVER